MLVNSGGKFQPLKIIPIVIPTRIYTAAGTVRLEHVYSIPRLSGAKTITIGPGKEASSPHIVIYRFEKSITNNNLGQKGLAV